MLYLIDFCVWAYAAAAGIPAAGGSGYQAFDVTIDPYTGMHMVSMGFGQSEVSCVVDTGSTDWWVLSQAYKPSASSVTSNQTLTLEYLNVQVSGEVVSDTVSIGDLSIENYPFAVLDNAPLPFYGLVGLAPRGSENNIGPSSYVDGKLTSDYYDTFVTQLKNEGEINSAAFSLWLNDGDTGSLIFGGVDTTKYQGTLKTVPLLNIPNYDRATDKSWIPGEISHYAVALNSVSLQNRSCSTIPVISDAHLPVVLDSGASSSLASSKFVDPIFMSFNSSDRVLGYDDQSGQYFTSSVPDGDLIFDFSGVIISVPIANLFTPAVNEQDGSTIYVFGITVNDIYTDVENDGRAVHLIGANILNSAYVVFDLENNEVAMAQAKHGNIRDQTIVAIQSAEAVQAPRYSETAWSGDYNTQTVSLFN